MNENNRRRCVIVGVSVIALAGAFGSGYLWHLLRRSDPWEASAVNLQGMFGERTLQASTAATGDTFAMATGPIDSEVEGVYMLDFLTGDLQCVVLNYRTAKFAAMFRTNVLGDLGVADPSKKPKFLLTTGAINFPRGATVARPANSVVYVLETTSGNYAAYGIPWRRELAATARPQLGQLLLLDIGSARTPAIRE